MKIEDIEYTQENKELFDEFIKPVVIGDIEKYNTFCLYRDNIKEFLRRYLNININIYFTTNYKGKIWFYVIEGDTWFKSSDEIEDIDILSYNSALNRAIRYIFKEIVNKE